MNKLLWIGSFITDEILLSLKDTGYKNPASVTSQKNILYGIETVSSLKFDSLNSISLSGFPTQKKVVLEDLYYSHGVGCTDVLVGYFNIKYINKILSQRRLVKKAQEWAINHLNDSVDIYVYEMRSACLRAAIEVKKIIPTARIILIVPDLPEFMDLHMSYVKRKLKAYDWKTIKGYLKHVDRFILYAQPMAKYLDIPDKQWMLMEGSVNFSESQDEVFQITNDSKKTIVMYSGSLQIGFGIHNLLEAFNYLNDSYELWITGGGTAENLVKKYADLNHRIKFFGYIPTKQQLKELQQKATIMINMRDPNEPASSYCFPSKLFEYMLLGKPVLTCKLNGIPEEYFKYLMQMKSISPQDIAEAIINVSKMDNLQNLVEQGREFILTEKNNIAQAKRILQFMR